MSHSARRSSVRKILENANAYEWSLEAIGVLRLCLSETVKLDVWDTEFAISGAMHSHDSDFQSTVIAGEFASCVWRPSVRAGSLFNRRLIGRKPGSPSAATTDVVRLKASREKTIGEAGRCLQRAREICATRALRGTVTLVELGQRTDLEHVFWPHDEECDRTQPRLATDAEIAAIAGYALERWFAPRRKDADAPVQRLEQQSRPTGRPVSGTSAQCTCPAPEPAATIDPARSRARRRALRNRSWRSRRHRHLGRDRNARSRAKGTRGSGFAVARRTSSSRGGDGVWTAIGARPVRRNQ